MKTVAVGSEVTALVRFVAVRGPVRGRYAGGVTMRLYDSASRELRPLDPVVPGPGPYPYPFYFNWHKGG